MGVTLYCALDAVYELSYMLQQRGEGLA